MHRAADEAEKVAREKVSQRARLLQDAGGAEADSAAAAEMVTSMPGHQSSKPTEQLAPASSGPKPVPSPFEAVLDEAADDEATGDQCYALQLQ